MKVWRRRNWRSSSKPLRQPSGLPGFGAHVQFSPPSFCSAIVLLPLAALDGDGGAAARWSEFFSCHSRFRAQSGSYRLSFGASLLAAGINAAVRLRDRLDARAHARGFEGKKIIDN